MEKSGPSPMLATQGFHVEPAVNLWRTRQGSNLQPSAPEANEGIAKAPRINRLQVWGGTLARAVAFRCTEGLWCFRWYRRRQVLARLERMRRVQ